MDDIIQGLAGPDEFRTAPLWGLGQLTYFLHDGRPADLKVAIAAHAGTGSEANHVVANWNALTQMAKQDLLNVLRSLHAYSSVQAAGRFPRDRPSLSPNQSASVDE